MNPVPRRGNVFATDELSSARDCCLRVRQDDDRDPPVVREREMFCEIASNGIIFFYVISNCTVHSLYFALRWKFSYTFDISNNTASATVFVELAKKSALIDRLSIARITGSRRKINPLMSRQIFLRRRTKKRMKRRRRSINVSSAF